MTSLRMTVVCLAAAIAATGCTTLSGTAPVRQAAVTGDADGFYRLGRSLQGQQRHELALAAYAQALAANPSHVASRNAVGALRSRRGEAELAEQAFRAALAADPSDASTYNNLGFHLLQQGRADEALVQLERAQQLAPLDGVVLGNLGKARVAANAQQATTNEMAAAAERTPAPHPSMQPTVQVARVAEGVYELRNAPAPQAAAPAAMVAAAATPPATPAAAPGGTAAAAALPRIEVSNGNGTSGLARRVLASLHLPQATPTRLTNDKPFGRASSRIEYVPGAEQAARAVNARLPATLPLAPVARLDRQVGVRVLLGKDFAAHPEQLASALR